MNTTIFLNFSEIVFPIFVGLKAHLISRSSNHIGNVHLQRALLIFDNPNQDWQSGPRHPDPMLDGREPDYDPEQNKGKNSKNCFCEQRPAGAQAASQKQFSIAEFFDRRGQPKPRPTVCVNFQIVRSPAVVEFGPVILLLEFFENGF